MTGRASIRVRRKRDGTASFTVRYRRGGRGYRFVTLATLGRRADAQRLCNLANSWLAVGLNPREELAKRQTETISITFGEWGGRYSASRVDLAAESVRGTNVRLRPALAFFSDRKPESLTVADCREYVAHLAETRAPASVRKYVETFRLLLDFAGLEPNPARDRRVKLPRAAVLEHIPVEADHLVAMLWQLSPKRHRLPVVLMEQTAMRPSETLALAWGDVDVAGSKLRLRAETTKTGRHRWVQVPVWLMGWLEGTCPLEDRTAERLLFPRASRNGLAAAMRSACKTAGVPSCTPKSMRHRRASLWHKDGLTGRELAERVGHAKPSITLDVYSHIIPPVEVETKVFEELLEDAFGNQGEAMVRPNTHESTLVPLTD